MSQTIKSKHLAAKQDVRNIINSFASLQEKFELTPDDATTKQIAAVLKYIADHIDEPAFPTEKDQAVINAAIKLAQKASNDENLDLSQVYGKLI